VLCVVFANHKVPAFIARKLQVLRCPTAGAAMRKLPLGSLRTDIGAYAAALAGRIAMRPLPCYGLSRE
jgi:hypothetical protein